MKKIFDVLTTEGYVENNDVYALAANFSIKNQTYLNCIDRVHSEKYSIVSI